MRSKTEHVARVSGRARSGRRAAAAALLLACAVAVPRASSQDPPRVDRRSQDRLEDARRREGEALLRLADNAMSGRASSDFTLHWTNDFFKAQAGTFVPFTVTFERGSLTSSNGLMYVRAARRDEPASRNRGGVPHYPFDIVFPVELTAPAGQPVRITRGFAVAPGNYDVYVALRERPADPLDSDRRLKGAVLKQPLSVPDFWTSDLSTSTIMLADRIDEAADTVTGDDVLEHPYIIGKNEIHRVTTPLFKRDRELIVVFLIYNPAVSADKNFEVEVDYRLFRKDSTAVPDPDPSHPVARPGERYVTRTTPQRFTPAAMGEGFDPVIGPILAGQGILLSSFQAGEYRLGITITDATSRRTLSREVSFSVVGS